nr:MAG TPA: hypothetical protein [Caudoviricetes sp.]
MTRFDAIHSIKRSRNESKRSLFLIKILTRTGSLRARQQVTRQRL